MWVESVSQACQPLIYEISCRNYFVLLTDSIKHFGFFLSILIVSNDHTCANLKSNFRIRVFSDKCQLIRNFP